VLLGLWLGLAGAVAGVFVRHGWPGRFPGFSGLYGLGGGRSLGLACALGAGGLVFAVRFRPVGFGFVPPLSGNRAWVHAVPFWQSGWVFSFVVVSLAGLQPVLHGWPGGFLARWWRFPVGCSRLLSVWRGCDFLVVGHCGAVGFCGAGQNTLFSMPNKSVKGTARHSGW